MLERMLNDYHIIIHIHMNHAYETVQCTQRYINIYESTTYVYLVREFNTRLYIH